MNSLVKAQSHIEREAAMKEKVNNKKEGRKKSFFRGFFEKLDKKMEEKAKSKPSCCGPSDKGKGSCCS